MLKRPDYTINNRPKLILIDLNQHPKTVIDHSLQKDEEIQSDINMAIEILCY